MAEPLLSTNVMVSLQPPSACPPPLAHKPTQLVGVGVGTGVAVGAPGLLGSGVAVGNGSGLSVTPATLSYNVPVIVSFPPSRTTKDDGLTTMSAQTLRVFAVPSAFMAQGLFTCVCACATGGGLDSSSPIMLNRS